MEKIRRVDRVLHGLEVDRPPVSLWYHFGVQHASGERFADITLEYFNYYDFDFLKVMNDIFYPPPNGLEVIRNKTDLAKLSRFDVRTSSWRKQFRALEIIASKLSGRAYFIDTVFDPWQSLKRNLAAENMKILMDTQPEALLQALDVVSENLIAYCRQSLALGSAGIFMSVPAAAEILSREDFIRFVKPFAMRVFEAVATSAPMNTAHIHGEDLFMQDVLDFPVAVFNWWDRGPQGPSLDEVKHKISGCVMGGIDQKLVARTSRAFLRNHVRQGIEMGGRQRFLLANGCSIDAWTFPGAIQTIVETAKFHRK